MTLTGVKCAQKSAQGAASPRAPSRIKPRPHQANRIFFPARCGLCLPMRIFLSQAGRYAANHDRDGPAAPPTTVATTWTRYARESAGVQEQYFSEAGASLSQLRVVRLAKTKKEHAQPTAPRNPRRLRPAQCVVPCGRSQRLSPSWGPRLPGKAGWAQSHNAPASSHLFAGVRLRFLVALLPHGPEPPACGLVSLVGHPL